MKKSVVWGAPKITSAKMAPGHYRNYQEFAKVQNARAAEQQEAQEYLHKAYPLMEALFKLKIETKEPFFIMRPLRYQTSEIQKADEVDDAFYRGSSNNEKVNDKFVDTIKTIMPGTQIVLKSLDMSLQEFVFEDAMNQEHAINFVDAKNIMMQSDIFESVKSFLQGAIK